MYLVSVLPEGFRELTLSNEEPFESYDLFCWNGEPRLDNWRAPQLAWLEDEFTCANDPTPDITSVSGVLAVNNKAKSTLECVLDDQVEFLPTIPPLDGPSWYLLNITNKLELMDVSKSKFKIKKNGKVGTCEHAFINPPPAEARIFEVKGFEPHIFVSEQVRSAIETAGLTGGLLRKYQNPQ